jgi:hypothetical protein
LLRTTPGLDFLTESFRLSVPLVALKPPIWKWYVTPPRRMAVTLEPRECPVAESMMKSLHATSESEFRALPA